MSISALALAALGLTANAQQACDLSDGLSLQPAAYQIESEACLRGIQGADQDSIMQNELIRYADAARTAAGQDSLKHLPALTKAATLHAYDMAVRGYVAHDDLEGRSHLDRVRMLDRTSLLGAFGANIAIIDESATAEQAHEALMGDATNRANLKRGEFNHTGIAAVRANGRIYLVQLFSGVDSQHEAPMTTDLNGSVQGKSVFAQSTTSRSTQTVTR